MESQPSTNPSSSWGRALLWSLIAAAFIGPGTVTTAARAGSEGGWAYVPFILLAIIAGFLLMEMTARITLVSGQTLGQVLGERRRWLAMLCFLAVLLGCVAYQAGNLLGALGGIQLLYDLPRWGVVILGAVALLVLWPGETNWIARALAGVVVIMALVFLVAALQLMLSGTALGGQGQVTTSTIIGLLGTTIVPYNFFLAAGLSQGQMLSDMRKGLGLSFIVGGIITTSILLVGSVATAFSSFTDLASTLDAMLGSSSKVVLGFGLFAAGFSSAVTAPLAAAIAGKELLLRQPKQEKVVRKPWFRLIWGSVLLIGILVALLELDIITVILAAQVANGLLLPLVAAIVLVFANDRKLLGDHINAHWQNLVGLLVAGFLGYKSFSLLLSKIIGASGGAFWGEWLAIFYCGALVWLMYKGRDNEVVGIED